MDTVPHRTPVAPYYPPLRRPLHDKDPVSGNITLSYSLTEGKLFPHIYNVAGAFAIFRFGGEKLESVSLVSTRSLEVCHCLSELFSYLAYVCSPSSLVYAANAMKTAPVRLLINLRKSVTSVGMVFANLEWA